MVAHLVHHNALQRRRWFIVRDLLLNGPAYRAGIVDVESMGGHPILGRSIARKKRFGRSSPSVGASHHLQFLEFNSSHRNSACVSTVF